MKSYPARRRMHRASTPTVSGSSQQFNRRPARNFSSQRGVCVSAVKPTRQWQHIREKRSSSIFKVDRMRLEASSRRRRSNRGEFVRLFSSSGSCYPAPFPHSIRCSVPRPGARLLTFIDIQIKSRYVEQMAENDADGVADEVSPAVTCGRPREFDNASFLL